MTDEPPASAFDRYLRETEHLARRPTARKPVPFWQQAVALLVGVALITFIGASVWRFGRGLL